MKHWNVENLPIRAHCVERAKTPRGAFGAWNGETDGRERRTRHTPTAAHWRAVWRCALFAVGNGGKRTGATA